MFWRGVLPPLVSVTVVRTISLSTAGVLTRRSASARERCCRTRYASCLRSVTVIRTISFSIAGVLAGRIAFAGQRYYRTHHVLQHLLARQVHCRGWHCDSISSKCLVPAFQADQTQRATDREDPWGGLGMFTLSLDVASVSVRNVLFQLFKLTRRNEQLTGKIHGEVWGCSLFRLTLHQYQFEINTMVSSR
jgi:hypothetical protein